MHLLNEGLQPITNVTATASFDVGSGIALIQPVASFGTLEPGVPTLGLFRADFSGSSPDKHTLSLDVMGDLFQQVTAHDLFVALDVHDPQDVNTWTVSAPKGNITTEVLSNYPDTNIRSLTTLTDFDWAVEYNTSFQGQFSDLPFGDPWWKSFALS